MVKEFRLAGISTIKEANIFAKEIFISDFNSRFSVAPQKKGDLHRQLAEFEKQNLDKIFSVKNERIVNNDFTVKFKGLWHQLESKQPVLVRPKETVCIEERISGQMFITLKNKNLNYCVLPERPKKINIPIIALSKSKPSWKPPVDHPWRRQLVFNSAKI